jgi:hypothetical protein
MPHRAGHPSPRKEQYGMGPGQSMAMAGNTGLASATEKQANTISRGLRNLGKDSSFKSIGQNIGEVGSKYRRPANVESYARKMDLINQGFANGARTFVGPDGIPRIGFNKTGVLNDQGKTILSMMNPELNPSQPTFSQVFGKDGDVRRAFTGYNSIKYDEPSGLYDSTLTGNTDQFGRTIGQSYSPISMQRTPGMMEGVGGGIMSMLANMVLPGSGFLMNTMQGAGNGMQGGMQKLIDYRPQLVKPRDDGFKGAIDRGSNLFKALLGGTPYNNGVMALAEPIDDNNIIPTNDYGLAPGVLNALINRAR